MMILIPAGPFLMGNPKEPQSTDLEAFYIDEAPITNSQFKDFVKDCPQWQKESGIERYRNTYYLYTWRKGLIYPKGKRDHPAVYINWFAAAAFCNWRSRKEGLQECYDNQFNCNFDANGYRLPTEAEFEKAARSGQNNTLYPWGNSIDKSKANYDNIIGDTTEIKSYPPNNFGLYDMAGNISHWCQNWFDDRQTHRSYRGGSWGNADEYLYVHRRFWMLPENTNPDFGFRCVKNA